MEYLTTLYKQRRFWVNLPNENHIKDNEPRHERTLPSDIKGRSLTTFLAAATYAHFVILNFKRSKWRIGQISMHFPNWKNAYSLNLLCYVRIYLRQNSPWPAKIITCVWQRTKKALMHFKDTASPDQPAQTRCPFTESMSTLVYVDEQRMSR